MAINTLPNSPAGEISHNTVREKINEGTSAINLLVLAATTSASMGNTVSNDTGVPNPAGIMEVVLAGNGGDPLMTPPPNPQPISGGDYNGYVKLLFTEISSSGEISIDSGGFLVGANGAGKYAAPHAYMSVANNVNSNVIGIVFGIERAGLVYFSQRATGGRLAVQGDTTNISGGGESILLAGDRLHIWACLEKAGTLSVHDANLGFQLVLPTGLA